MSRAPRLSHIHMFRHMLRHMSRSPEYPDVPEPEVSFEKFPSRWMNLDACGCELRQYHGCHSWIEVPW
jgi:hypothetical protein